MSIDSYLRKIAGTCYVRDLEKKKIRNSTNNIKSKLHSYFGDSILEVVVFGSYTRDTILPRNYDSQSDVDIMIVFKSDGSTPQTFLDRLKRFTGVYYYQSQIKQSHPTIKLDLNHITFELVPALTYVFRDTYSIPSPPSAWSNWMDTKPNSFNNDLTRANLQNGSYVKPAARVLKRWNAQQGYPFKSYELEKSIVNTMNSSIWSRRSLHAVFKAASEGLSLSYTEANWKHDRLDRLKRTVKNMEYNLKYGLEQKSEIELARIISV